MNKKNKTCQVGIEKMRSLKEDLAKELYLQFKIYDLDTDEVTAFAEALNKCHELMVKLEEINSMIEIIKEES